MRSTHEVKLLFTDKLFIGDILRWTTFLERELDCALALYFARGDRLQSMMSVLLSEIDFGRKIDILAHLPLRQGLKSYQASLAGLRRFRRIRNIVAHQWRVSHKDVPNLLNGEDCRTMLSTYPEGTTRLLSRTRVSLGDLTRTNEFKDPLRQLKQRLQDKVWMDALAEDYRSVQEN